MTVPPDTTPAAVEAMIERLLAGDLCTVELAPGAAAMLRDVAAERDALKQKQTIRGLNCSLNFPCEHYKAAEAERDRLAAMVEKLRGYARHRQGCDLVRWDLDCTCGLSEVLEESENG